MLGSSENEIEMEITRFYKYINKNITGFTERSKCNMLSYNTMVVPSSIKQCHMIGMSLWETP